MRLKISVIILILTSYQIVEAQVTLSGTVKEHNSKENLPFVNISVKDLSTGTTSNAYGFYSITLPAGKELEVKFSSVGYWPGIHKVHLLSDTVLNIEMLPVVTELEEVIVTPDHEETLSKEAGRIQLPVAMVKQMPAFLGEKDVIKA